MRFAPTLGDHAAAPVLAADGPEPPAFPRPAAHRGPPPPVPLPGQPTLGWRSVLGWVAYLWLVILLSNLLAESRLSSAEGGFLIVLGVIGLWRYSLGLIHFARAMLFLHWAFPTARRQAAALGAAARPSKVYFLVTSYRIAASTSALVYRSVIAEAIACGAPATVMASLVELADERLVRMLWERMAPPERVRLSIVRIPGTGKRDGLAQAFRAISRDMPDDNAVVAVIDGDTLLHPGVIAKTAPFLRLFPKVGALTTNEFCQVRGGTLMSDWHRLRFAQRHMNMCSMSLSRRVLTLTGRMSVFRASVVTNPAFVADVENDSLRHWRLGNFKFLTGDDKSSWYSLMKLGYDTYYVPDAAIDTLEEPPDPSFWRASRQLMFRWYGNSLRQNSRATWLGPRRLGPFTYYVLWDQRIGMWTSLVGLSAALMASLKYGHAALLAYALWVALSRLYMTLLLVASGHRISPLYPLLLYYNQIIGSLTKIYVFFHLDQQSWTRQKTTLERDLDPFQRWLNSWSSAAMTVSAGSMFLALVLNLI